MMAISTSPRKIVPLNPGDDWEKRPRLNLATGPVVTRRAFFCGVVVEGPNDGENLTEDVQDLVASLGERLSGDRERNLEDPNTASPAERPTQLPQNRKTDANVFADSIDELVATERSYVKKLRILKESYADPLRSYARSKDTAIIPAYEANILFGNIDQLVPVNEAFLHDLELMAAPDGERKIGGIGDVALKHFKDLRAFDCYKRYYTKREEAQAIFKRETEKRSSSGFASFVERVKYATTDIRNRVGLRELLMEPVQRIPRYTMLFSAMLANMPISDPQRARLAEAYEYASRIAYAETDDHTKLAAIMARLAATVEGFPPALISSGRRFIDCIDVEDFGGEAGFEGFGAGSSTPSSSFNSASSSGALHCTLFLFDDKLMITKRPNGDKSGRALVGLDDLEKVVNGSGGSGNSFNFGFGRNGSRKSGMSCKGVMDVTDIVATDVSGTDIHLYLEHPPTDQSERWSGRPLRIYSVVQPPHSSTYDPTRSRTEAAKRRFLENLWHVQALYRTRAGESVALVAEESEVEARGGKVTLARTYFNVYQRTAFLKEPKKTKIVLHIDSDGIADPIPFGMGKTAPLVVVRVRPMPGELCRYTVSSSDPNDDDEQDIVQTMRVPERILHTIHQYGLFKFQTSAMSRPATPSAGTRSRAHLFGLDVISRNLFGALPSSSKGERDPFGSSSGSYRHRRTKSAMSRGTASSHHTGASTTTTEGSDSLTKFSSRSNSTVATSLSMSISTSEDSFIARSVSKPRKLIKHGASHSRSPGRAELGAVSEGENHTGSSRSRRSGHRGRSMSVSQLDESLEYSDPEELISDRARSINSSELDLKMRLDLARRNSRNQNGKELPDLGDLSEGPVEETIYEEAPPVPTRPNSRLSRLHSYGESAGLAPGSPPRSRPTTPSNAYESSLRGRSTSTHSRERRPIGPRSPSPLPPTSLAGDPKQSPLALDLERALDQTLVSLGHDSLPCTPTRPDPSRHSSTSSQIPRSKRQPFTPSGNTDATPKSHDVDAGANVKTPTASTAIEPLSIKKKTSNATQPPNGDLRTPSRKTYSRNSPLVRNPRMERRPLPTPQRSDSTSSTGELEDSSNGPERLFHLAESTRDDLESSCRALKRIKLEVNALAKAPVRRDSPAADERRIHSPVALRATPSRTNAANREALQRLEEMRQLIGQRGTDRRPHSVLLPQGSGSSSSIHSLAESSSVSSESLERVKAVEELVTDVGRDVARAAGNNDQLIGDLRRMTDDMKSAAALEETRMELRSQRRQTDLMKNLLADATTENEIMYESFNEELDGMFNDVNLPPDEAWQAMAADLRQTKEARNNLSRENAQLKRRLQEVEMQRDEWAELLRMHGLIP